MKKVEVFKWYLPPRVGSGPRAKPYLSRWKMTAEDAAARGAIRPEPTSRELLAIAETPEEEKQLRRAGDTSALGGPAPSGRIN
jgi:hypothetical protein